MPAPSKFELSLEDLLSGVNAGEPVKRPVVQVQVAEDSNTAEEIESMKKALSRSLQELKDKKYPEYEKLATSVLQYIRVVEKENQDKFRLLVERLTNSMLDLGKKMPDRKSTRLNSSH